MDPASAHLPISISENQRNALISFGVIMFREQSCFAQAREASLDKHRITCITDGNSVRADAEYAVVRERLVTQLKDAFDEAIEDVMLLLRDA